MICPHPHPGEGKEGEEHGRGGSTGLDSRDGSGARRTRQWLTMRLKRREDNVGDVQGEDGGGGGEGVCRKKDIRHFPELFKSP